MKPHRTGLILALALALAAGGQRAAAQAQTIAIVDVTVLPMDSARVLEHQTVVVRDGRITAMGPTARTAVPAGAVRVDGRGKFLMPGLSEMHAHLPNPQNQPAELVERVLFLYVANGVVTARGMQGTLAVLPVRDSIARGRLLGPRLWVAGPQLGGNSATSPDVGRRMVEEQKAAGFDHIKIQEGLALETYDTIAATAKRLGIRFAGHVPDAVPLAHALAVGQATIDHLDNYVATLGGPNAEVSDSAIRALAHATKAAGTWVVPTMALWETFNGDDTIEELRQRAELRYVPEAWVNNWATAVGNMRSNNPDPGPGLRTVALRARVLKALSDAGVGILMGTDSPQLFSVPGFSTHREIASMAAAGMTPFQILQSGTRNVAVYYNATSDFGTVAVGQRADLLLLDANPLADATRVSQRAGVVVGGRWLPREELDRRLETIAANR